MTRSEIPADKLAMALRNLSEIEREVFLAMLQDEASYPAIAARLGVSVADTERAFAASLVRVADALDAPPPGQGVRRWLDRLAAAARLARRSPRR